MIQIVPVIQVDAVWPQLMRGMEIACKKGGGQYTQDWLWTLCRKGDAMLVIIHEDNQIQAGIVVQVQNWTGKQVLNVLGACGRDIKSWLQALHEFGCGQFGVQSIVFEGRPGWKITPGVKVVRHVYEIEVFSPAVTRARPPQTAEQYSEKRTA